MNEQFGREIKLHGDRPEWLTKEQIDEYAHKMGVHHE